MKTAYWAVLLGLVLALSHNDAGAVCYTTVLANTPDERFIVDVPAGVVTDRVTGLVWQRCSVGQNGSDCSGGSAISVNWQDALQAAQASTVAGYDDWRLPNVKELASIVEYKCYEPAINTNVFPGTGNVAYWSSSPYEHDLGNAWRVFFNIGSVYSQRKTESNSVRLVRGGL